MNNVEAHARFGLELAERNAALVGAFRLQMMGLVQDVGKLIPDGHVLDVCDAHAVAQVLYAAMAGLEEEANRIVEVMGWFQEDLGLEMQRRPRPPEKRSP